MISNYMWPVESYENNHKAMMMGRYLQKADWRNSNENLTMITPEATKQQSSSQGGSLQTFIPTREMRGSFKIRQKVCYFKGIVLDSFAVDPNNIDMQ